MAYTQSDLTSVQSAIASGELSATVAGRSVTYRSLDDLLRAAHAIKAGLAEDSASSATKRLTPRYQVATFDDC